MRACGALHVVHLCGVWCVAGAGAVSFSSPQPRRAEEGSASRAAAWQARPCRLRRLRACRRSVPASAIVRHKCVGIYQIRPHNMDMGWPCALCYVRGGCRQSLSLLRFVVGARFSPLTTPSPTAHGIGPRPRLLSQRASPIPTRVPATVSRPRPLPVATEPPPRHATGQGGEDARSQGAKHR